MSEGQAGATTKSARDEIAWKVQAMIGRWENSDDLPGDIAPQIVDLVLLHERASDALSEIVQPVS
jgi:hypothetical protein